MKNNLLTVVKKELSRVFTDKRLVFTTFILPALSIAIIYSLMGTMMTRMFNEREEYIPKVYVQNSPVVFRKIISEPNWKDKMDLHIISEDVDIKSLKDKIQAGEIDLLAVFEEDFSKRVENYRDGGEVPQVMTFYNSSEDHSSDAKTLLKNILGNYEQQLIGARMGNIEHTNAFDIDRDNQEGNIVDQRKATGKGLGMLLPMLIAIFLFAGAMGIGMDSIAGEKERGTMATLLVTPVRRETIAFGKIISLGIIAFISAGSSFIGILLSLPFSSAMFGGGVNGGEKVSLAALKFGPIEYSQLILIMITLVGIYVGVICLLSIIAKNVKEAGTYVVPVYMLVMVSGFLNMFTNKAPEIWQFLIPVYGSVVAIKSLLTFELTWIHVMISCTTSVITTIILVWLIKKMFNSEKIMFSA